MITVVVDTGDLSGRLSTFYQALRGRSYDALGDVAQEGLDRIVAGAYWTNRTHKTEESFRVRPAGDLRFVLRSSNRVAVILDRGSKAHVIEASKKKALGIHLSGGPIARKRVNHPGTKARNYEAREAQIAEGVLPERLAGAAAKAIDEAGLR